MSVGGLIGIVSLIVGVKSTVLAVKDSDNDTVSHQTVTAVIAAAIAAAAITSVLMYIIMK